LGEEEILEFFILNFLIINFIKIYVCHGKKEGEKYLGYTFICICAVKAHSKRGVREGQKALHNIAPVCPVQLMLLVSLRPWPPFKH